MSSLINWIQTGFESLEARSMLWILVIEPILVLVELSRQGINYMVGKKILI
jgi:hypothetical protein